MKKTKKKENVKVDWDSSMPGEHKLFLGIYNQAKKDIDEYVKFVKSGKKCGKYKKIELYKEFLNSIYFFENRYGYLSYLSHIVNINLDNPKVKQEIKNILDYAYSVQQQITLFDFFDENEIYQDQEVFYGI